MEEIVYICDSDKKIAVGKCTGIGCKRYGDCYLTKDKEYAKEYITVYEAERMFESCSELYRLKGDIEKLKQYQNALKSVRETIAHLEEKPNKTFVKQLSLFEELL